MGIKDTVEIEKLLRVHGDEGSFIELGSSPENSDWLEMRTVDKASRDYFGDIRFVMPPDYAYALGKALISLASQMGGKDCE